MVKVELLFVHLFLAFARAHTDFLKQALNFRLDSIQVFVNCDSENEKLRNLSLLILYI